MAGTALTDAFMIGAATVMVGPVTDLFLLNPDNHSIGLVKNFTMQANPAYVELTQGVKGTIVASVLTSNKVNATMEVFEYTSKNFAYALGLDGSTFTSIAADHSLLAGATTGTAMAPDTSISVTAGDGVLFTVGDWVELHEPTAGDDEIYIDKISAKATDALTLTFGIPAALTTAATVTKVNRVNIGSLDDQPFLAAKVVGVISNNKKITILIPKLRVSKGFNVQFATDAFHNMPFEFAVYDLVTTDPFYTTFKGLGSAALFADE